MKILFLTFLATLCIQLFYYLVIFSRGAFSSWKTSLNHVDFPVSIVICGKNAATDFEQNLPKVLNQDYPNFEVIVVDDHSTDNSLLLLQQYQSYNDHLTIVPKEQVEDRPGKKAALFAGASAAKNPILLFTDADCKPATNSWVSLLVRAFQNEEINLVLGVSPNYEAKGFWQQFFQFETLWTALNYISFYKLGMPYMGVGRNMAVRKTFFTKQFKALLDSELASGDDDLLVNKGANKKNTALCLDSDAFTYSDGPTSLAVWWKQKTRHLSAGQEYNVFHQILLSLYPVNQWVFYATFLFFLSTPLWPITTLAAIFVVLIQAIIHAFYLHKIKRPDIALQMPIYQLIWVLFLPFILIYSTIQSKQTWK